MHAKDLLPSRRRAGPGLQAVPRPAPAGLAGLLALVMIAMLMAACEKKPSDPVPPKASVEVVETATT